ncbi:hypothetical protein DFJ58DRAFT_842354 [Suillus subalutaceus]|uniref:uncharacterized protein n=1 Tax=Suillus subalutaceus TaxID=48586 RepID=UPI001B879EA1|nr:uncharacterized protein DFJ58DRAFT_842354 [Suillus subalutaceus]KAG1850858.1 hypothetical protein DFJ58DRAFT_842354 [Suillus subalutaceus]
MARPQIKPKPNTTEGAPPRVRKVGRMTAAPRINRKPNKALRKRYTVRYDSPVNTRPEIPIRSSESPEEARKRERDEAIQRAHKIDQAKLAEWEARCKRLESPNPAKKPAKKSTRNDDDDEDEIVELRTVKKAPLMIPAKRARDHGVEVVELRAAKRVRTDKERATDEDDEVVIIEPPARNEKEEEENRLRNMEMRRLRLLEAGFM